jgi:hypothetical protein
MFVSMDVFLVGLRGYNRRQIGEVRYDAEAIS